VELPAFVADTSPTVAAVAGTDGVGTAEPGVRTAGQLEAGGRVLDVLITSYDEASSVWRPTVERPVPVADGQPAIVLSEKAARDLGLDPGDHLLVRHLMMSGAGATFARTDFVVAGLHPSPLRSLAFVEHAQLAGFGLAGAANTVVVTPAPGTSADDVQRRLFEQGIAVSVTPVSDLVEQARDTVGQFLDVLRVAQLAILGLAVLIAWNTSAISVDERTREHATMLAFGVPVRRVLAMLTVESLVVGTLGTALGIAAGYGFLSWMTQVVIADTIPEIAVRVTLSATTVVVTLALGIAAVATAPLLTMRRLRSTDIAGQLRVVE
jgi:putative ABC transport system permease protein